MVQFDSSLIRLNMSASQLVSPKVEGYAYLVQDGGTDSKNR